jgi:hypothetical protein
VAGGELYTMVVHEVSMGVSIGAGAYAHISILFFFGWLCPLDKEKLLLFYLILLLLLLLLASHSTVAGMAGRGF